MSGRAYTAAAETRIGAGEVVGGIDYSLIPDKGLRPYAENVVRQMFMLDRKTIEVSLETAGIVVVDYLWPSSVVSSSAAWMLFACAPQDGRIDLEFDFGDPDLISKANGAWWQLVVDHGLLDENRHFLVSVGPEDGELPARPHWARVRLQHDWDVVGRGTDYGVLGGPPGRPGFVMMSLDEHVLIGGTTWHDWISIVALPNPIAAPAIRKAMRLP